MNRRIGMTTSVPIEIILAAGDTPIDLNNIFITDENPQKFLDIAELAGYPRGTCAWIKGIYGVVVSGAAQVDCVVAVTQGDCSNTHALMETLELENIETIPFGYPFGKDRNALEFEMTNLAKRLGTTISAAEEVRLALNQVRGTLRELDNMTWEGGLVTGEENHRYLVNASDLNGDPNEFSKNLEAFLLNCRKRKIEDKNGLRLGYVGVPSIFTDLYEVIADYGAKVVFNETQRQFAMLGDYKNLIDQYLEYTYPYGIFPRLEDISFAVGERAIDGVIHYAQSFCFRQIEDLILRKRLNVPVLTLEGDRPGKMDARTKTRLEAFIEMLSLRK